jgi:elongation factor P--beta-lysine ligase
MLEYKRLNFKNHPSTPTKLVMFLAINMSFEAIEKLTTQEVACHQAKISENKKSMAAASKPAMLAADKADEAKKLFDLLCKQVVGLEKK